jgi:hypothetical protein
LFIFCPSMLIAQPARPDMHFGSIGTELFAPLVYAIDSSADAIILFDQGLVHFDQPAYGNYGFSIVYDRHTRIRLLHRNAFGLATVILARSKKGAAGLKIENLKGITCNLEEGKVIQTTLDKSNIFTEESGNYELKKIVFPAVGEGCIIEYSYRIVYPGFGYVPYWEFQGDYPILWSEYDITIPSALEYIIKQQGYLKFAVDTSILTTQMLQIKLPSASFGGSYNDTWKGAALERIWALSAVPPMAKREPYITALKNYKSRIEFQLSALHLPGIERSFTNTWEQFVDELLKNEKFGLPLKERNHWLKNELPAITGTENSPVGSAQKIYSYLRDHFECSHIEGIYISQPFRKTWDEKKGNIADINLLLTAMLRQQGLEADPVLLSTRVHGKAYEVLPILGDYNYVITRLVAGDQTYLLDATGITTGFGQLPEFCYNGSGRVIDETHLLIPLVADSQTEIRSTLVILGNDSLGYEGSFAHKAGVFESMEFRNRLNKMKTEDFFETVRKTFPPYKTMEESGIDSLDKPEEPLSWHYNMKYHFSTGIVYFNPVLHERISTNPFIAPERHYPVEMPFAEDFSYVINMEIPKGYEITELPRSERIQLEGGKSALFEYIIEKNGDGIQLLCRLQIKKTYFGLDEYKSLREFFASVIRKEKEQIVFKRK